MKSTTERLAEMQIPRTLLCSCIKEEGYHAYKPTTINELSDKDMEMRLDACENLLTAFPTLAVRGNVLMTDECPCFSAHVRIIFICGPNITLISMRKFYNTPPLMS